MAIRPTRLNKEIIGRRPTELISNVFQNVKPLGGKGIEKYKFSLTAAEHADLCRRVDLALREILTPLCMKLSQLAGRQCARSSQSLAFIGAKPSFEPSEGKLQYSGTRSKLLNIFQIDDFGEQQGVILSPEIVLSQQEERELSPYVLVGDYGKPLAVALIDSARCSYALIESAMKQQCQSVDARYGDFLEEFTFQSTAAEILKEGVQTIVGLTSLFTYHAIRGYPINQLEQLLRDTALNGLFHQHAYAPLGFNGPLPIFGVVPNRITAEDHGSLKISGEMLSAMQRMRLLLKEGEVAPSGLGTGCPLAKGTSSGTFKESGIDLLVSRQLALAGKILTEPAGV